MKDTNAKTFTLETLCALVDMSKRTVRYYIQESMVERPVGGGRSAYYTEAHLEQLLTIKRWQHAGLSLERIRQIMAQPQQELPPPPPRTGAVEVWSHLIIDQGIELHIEPQQAGLTPEQLRQLLHEVKKLTATMKAKEPI